MVKIIGIRFRNAGKVYYFDPKDYEIHAGDHVIVETARGVEYGTAIGGVREVEDDKVVSPLKEVIRVATAEDDAHVAYIREKEKDALRVCREKIQKHGLEMKLIDAEYTFDNNKVLFYFTADGRIDFRELVKDLASVFRMRIELRQVGVRDETKLLGGIGICGRVLCCHSYLSDFAPVSIRMAKDQNLSLNPTKISGVCGRLMCCLKNEEDTYEYLNSRLPAQGDTVTTADGRKGTVQYVNVLRERVKVIFEENEEKELEEFDAKDLTFRPRKKKERSGKNKDKEPVRSRVNRSGDSRDGKDRDERDRSGDSRDGKSRDDRNRTGDNCDGKDRDDRDRSGDNRDGKDRNERDRSGDNRDGKGRNDRERTSDNRDGKGRNDRDRTGDNRDDKDRGERDRSGDNRDGKNREDRDREHHGRKSEKAKTHGNRKTADAQSAD